MRILRSLGKQKLSTGKMANLQGMLVTISIAITMWPIAYLANSSAIAENWILQFGSVLIFLPSFLFTVYKLLPRESNSKRDTLRQRNFLYYTCCVFAITSSFSLMIALEVLGYIDGFVDFYLDNSEPYLASPFGVADSLWDPTVRFILYLTIIYKFDNGEDYTRITLYWIGDMMQGMMSIILGALIGNYAEEVNPTILFNLLYFIVPVFVLKHVLQTQAQCKSKGAFSQNMFKLTDILLATGLVFSAVLGFIKGLAAFGSPLPIVKYYETEFDPYVKEPGMFGAVHCIMCMVYLIPIQVLCAYCIAKGSGGRLAENLSILLAGAITQSTWCYLFPSISSQTLEQYRVVKNIYTAMFLNLFPVIISHFSMWRLIVSSVVKNVKKGK